MTAYATYSDLEATLDSNIIAQLCGDGGTPMPGPNPMTTTALERATGIVRSYIRVGGIYSEAELTILSAANDPLMINLVVDLAAEFLVSTAWLQVDPGD